MVKHQDIDSCACWREVRQLLTKHYQEYIPVVAGEEKKWLTVIGTRTN